MMKSFVQKGFCILAVLLFLLSCHRGTTAKTIQWSANDSKEAPIALIEKTYGSHSFLTVQDAKIKRFRQSVFGAEVLGSIATVIYPKKSSQPEFIQAQYIENISPSYASTIYRMTARLKAVALQLPFKYSNLKNASFVSPPKVIYWHDNGAPKVVFQIYWLEGSGERGHRWLLNTRLQVLKDDVYQNSFTSGRALVYPNGPRWSQLDQVDLLNLQGNGFLLTDHIKMTTRADRQAQASDQIFEYEEDDVRFDQVQAFHLAQTAMTDFEKKFQFQVENPVELITHIGFPEKKSVMFYFQHKINLGQGDGISYKNILWDPTIVTHEMMHAYIDELSLLEPGAVNEAFADYFACTLLDHAELGEASYMKGDYTRSLNNDKHWQDLNGGTYNDSLVLSSLLWDLRKTWGTKTADAFAMSLLIRLSPKAQIEDIPNIIHILRSDISDFQQNLTLKKILDKKGWPHE
jgi:hypothetical protein